jgi:peptidyl-prolyl cis-trans isomerase SurA
MKPSTRLVCLPLLLASLTAWPQTRDLSTSGELLDRIVAVVNDGVVLQSELNEQIRLISVRLADQGVQLPPAGVLRQQVLERLILMQIQLQRADRLDIQVDEEQLSRTLERIAQRNNISFDQLPALLAQQGLDYTAYREDIRRELIVNQVRQRDVDARVTVSQREMDQLLERQAQSDQREFELAHILIGTRSSATPEQIEAAGERAQLVYRRLLQGEDFGEMAVSYSEAQDALDGGYLGWREATQLPTIFAEVVPDMSAGQVSEPIRSSSGYHIIKVIDVRGAEKIMVTEFHARHILMVPNELVTDEQVSQELSRIREKVLGGADFGEFARTVSEDPGSQGNGGDLGWNEPGAFVPEFDEQIAQLTPGEISEPFRTRFGWHIVQLLETREQDATEENRRNEAYFAIMQRKVAEQTELWVRRLRDEAFVEYRL